MAAYGAAVSLKNTIRLILGRFRIQLFPTDPISRHLVGPNYAVFDNLNFRPMMLASAAALSLKILNNIFPSIQQSLPISVVYVFQIPYYIERVTLALIAATLLQIMVRRFIQNAFIEINSVLTKAHGAICRLQKVLLKLEETSCSKNRTKVNELDERIKDAIWGFEDLLESHVYEQILPQLESSSQGGKDHFSVDLRSLGQSVDLFVERMAVFEEMYNNELLNMLEEEGEPISSRIDFGGINSVMVGSSDVFELVRDYLIEQEGNRLLVMGMAGVGKTTLVKKLFEDLSIQRHFELRAWVKVGRKCKFNETLLCILAQVDPNTYKQMLIQGDNDDEEKLVALLKERLMHKRCLIVLDDVWKWDTQVMDNLSKENVHILVTSRIKMKEFVNNVRVCMLNEDESNELLGQKVFGEEGFPPHLKKLGETIAKKCEGLPLMLITVAEHLCKEDKTIELWTEVAQKQHNSVFMDSYNQISEVLFSSYDYLPQYLKMCFLYTGAFPPFSNIERDHLVSLLIAEGFIERLQEETLHGFFYQCFSRLGQHNLVLIGAEPSESWFSTKDFRVHSCWQHVCRKEASKIKFLHVIQSCDDVMKDQRRLCAHSNTLFAFKQVHDSIKSDCAPIARSLLCLGPYHQYPVPIHDMDLKFLKVLDADKVRFYHIPLEIMKLVRLQYLSLTCNLEIPVSISNLIHLRFLIIKPHLNIRKYGVVSYMPAEIWDMQELEYIKVIGRDLPTPNSDATLKHLDSIVGVSAKSCTREILKKIPNLGTLGIIMELKPYDDDDVENLAMVLGYISEQLQELVQLSYHVMNPNMKNEFMAPLSMSPSSLTSLHLSGSGCPWKHMNDIGSKLPNLRELILKHYAFRGSEWNIEPSSFLKLETLVIEDTDLVRWRAQGGSLPMLKLLSLQHCYKLQQLDWTRDPSTV